MASFTLRKALRLKKQIEAKLSGPSFAPSVSIDIDDKAASSDVGSRLAAEQDKFMQSVTDHIRLSAVLCDLRTRIDAANNASGVTALLARLGHVDRQIALYKPIAAAEAADSDLVSAKLARKRDSANRSVPSVGYGRHDDATTLSASPLSREVIALFKGKLVDLRREREEIEEDRLALNNNRDHAVEIGDDVVKFLAGLDIV
jgi:hypothetical protein